MNAGLASLEPTFMFPKSLILHLGTRLSGTKLSMSICHYVIDIRIIKQGINSRFTDQSLIIKPHFNATDCQDGLVKFLLIMNL